MKRIIIHWTGGSNSVSDIDRKHYHFIVDGNGEVHNGDLKPEANNDCTDGNYAAHTRRCNTGSIGVALAGMHGAKEVPFDAGNYPINYLQLETMADLCADLCETYGIKVTPKTVLTHAEVEPTLGIKQRGKWDICWLPDMDERVGDAIEVGNRLRRMIADNLKSRAPDRKERKSPVQSTTVQASAACIAAGAAKGATAISALDGTAQIVIAGLACVVVLGALWIMRERLRKWADGDR